MKLIRALFDRIFDIKRDSMGRNISYVCVHLDLMFGGDWGYSVDDKVYECYNTGKQFKCYEIKL